MIPYSTSPHKMMIPSDTATWGQQTHVTRRNFLRAALGTIVPLLAGCGAHGQNDIQFSEASLKLEPDLQFDQTVLRTVSNSGPAIVLLHEILGLSPANIQLAHRIAKQGFRVYLPLLFGAVGQSNFVSGYFQACFTGKFECSRLSARSPVLEWVETVCNRVSKTSDGPIGVIGMCLTGIFPLALLGNRRVQAAVLCQPTVPFNALFGRPIGAQKTDLGLSAEDLEIARQSDVSFLALRYACDQRCPKERTATLRELFPQRVADIELEGQGHSTLAGNFNQDAFTDTIRYLKVRLGSATGSTKMIRAKLNGQTCELTAGGKWRVG